MGTWEGESKSGDIDLTYGVDVAAQPTKDIASLPRTVWGKASTSVSGWLASVRAEIDAQSPEAVALEVELIMKKMLFLLKSMDRSHSPTAKLRQSKQPRPSKRIEQLCL